MRLPQFAVLLLSVSLIASAAELRTGRYALILSDPSVVEQVRDIHAVKSATATLHRARLGAAHAQVKSALAARRIRVTGETDTVLNAVYVTASPDEAAALRQIPGVVRVQPLRVFRLKLDTAVRLVNGPGAWNATGGPSNAGAGTKIAILDTGIDQTHPAFEDPTLAVPAAYPKCDGADCDFTNNKVIVARSYVRALAAGYGSDPAATSRPDDLSPRDRIGHGTAVASAAAAATNSGPIDTITGMAPKAWLGNYKIFGSPGVNGGASEDGILMAIDDAVKDGMDVAVMSFGAPALGSPTDVGAACGLQGTSPCDPEAAAIAHAMSAGMVVVAAAGNEGDLGSGSPTYGTVGTPGYTPEAIAVGATTNAHRFVNTLRIPGDGVPQNLQAVAAVFGDGPKPGSPISAPLRDVAALGNDGLACAALPGGSLAGTFALIERGTCNFSDKVKNAQDAGAVGVVFYNANSTTPSSPGGLSAFQIPALIVDNASGVALKQFLAGNADRVVTLDPTVSPIAVSNFNTMAYFSSAGPSVGNLGLKPDVSAPGTDIYMAAQSYDPNGPLYSADRYIVANGTSFSTPIVGGGAALVKQARPNLTPAQIKSALVNTAAQDISDGSGAAKVVEVGAGRMDAGAAVAANVAIEPAVLSFGAVQTLPATQAIKLTNTGSAPVSLRLSVQQRSTDAQARVSVEQTAVSLSPGQSTMVNVTLSGNAPAAGSYEGAIWINGADVPLHVPYLYLKGSGVAADIVPILGFDEAGTVGEDVPDGALAIRLIDQFGVPVAGAPVTFRAGTGGGRVYNADRTTDKDGFALANATFGTRVGAQTFTVTAGSKSYTFNDAARLKPTITSAVNSASFQAGQGFAPGSYITLFGTGLSDDTGSATTTRAPLSIHNVSVSFDAPGVSVPGRLSYVSPKQVNVQIPWELRGQASAKVKVSIDMTTGSVFTIPLADYAPAVFEYTAGTTQLAAALDEASRVVGPSNPAQRGHVVSLYVNGLGAVDQTPSSGEPASSDTLLRTQSAPTVTIGGVPAQVTFSGLAPGFAGLYQVNVVVPADAPAGVQSLALSQGGVAAKVTNIQVQ